MKLDVYFSENIADLSGVAVDFAEYEACGYAGAWLGEARYEPTLPLAIAALHTSELELGTAVSVAFARSPTVLAQVANDLNRASEGRFILGLGSNMKSQIERRFGMPYSAPARRMRDYIRALHAVWDCWEAETPLAFESEFYSLDQMPDYYRPLVNLADHGGAPRVFIGAFGKLMLETAGEVADGALLHPLVTRRYLEQAVVPRIERGRGRRDPDLRQDFELSLPAFTATGRDEAEMKKSVAQVRSMIGFYAATPRYRSVFDSHGWTSSFEAIGRAASAGEWGELGRFVDDEMFAALAVVAEPQRLAQAYVERAGPAVDRVCGLFPRPLPAEIWGSLLATGHRPDSAARPYH